MLPTNGHEFRIVVGILSLWAVALFLIPWCSLWGFVKRTWSSVAARFSTQRQSMDSIDAEVGAVLRQRQLEWQADCVQKFVALSLCVTLSLTARMLQNITTGMAPDERIMSGCQDYMSLGVVTYSLSFRYMYKIAATRGGLPKFLEVCGVCHMLAILGILAGARPEMIHMTNLALLPFRCLLAGTTLNTWLTSFYGLLYTAVYAVVISTIPGRHENYQHILNSLVLALVLVCADATTQRLIETEARGVTKVNIMCRASGRLLDLFCDAVMEVSHDWDILSDARKMAALLFLGQDNTMIGSSFRHYMHEQCLQKFDSALHVSDDGHQNEEADPPAGALPVRLRDSFGNWLSFELSWLEAV
eukprot:TRINITY_DN20929_c0_g1_i5.p1 TRINITY_DN20929_c0_g1~~TRINITY_DN20929_c0_g1_i5.p1  ORF type:complete len:359 (+),score=37.52 TRINITY_DN20929_c0_g1_i5:87-1163(+)